MNLLKKFLNLFLLFLPLVAISALAQPNYPSGGFGGVAANINEPVDFLTNIVHVGCYIIGGMFLFTSIIKFVEHRRNPYMVPISTVIFLLVAGIILILLPLLSILFGINSGYSQMQ